MIVEDCFAGEILTDSLNHMNPVTRTSFSTRGSIGGSSLTEVKPGRDRKRTFNLSVRFPINFSVSKLHGAIRFLDSKTSDRNSTFSIGRTTGKLAPMLQSSDSLLQGCCRCIAIVSFVEEEILQVCRLGSSSGGVQVCGY